MHGNAKLPKTLGRKIQRLRKRMKLTQEELAERVGISLNYQGFIEQGRYMASVAVLEKIAKHLKVKISDLFSK